MSIGLFLRSALRSLAITAATVALALGLLVIFHPFEALTPSGNATALAALEAQIQLARDDLRQAQDALQKAGPAVEAPSGPAIDSSGAIQQAAVARDRADLARRNAKTIRDALAAGTDLSALPGIRDSVVIGQMLAQRIALEAQIAEQGARLGPSHPNMRALKAQRDALIAQIAAQAAAIATALEAEAAADDAEIAQQTPQTAVAAPSVTATVSTPDLAQDVVVRQAELDRLMTTYFQQKVTPGAARLDPLRGFTNPLNLWLAALAGLAAMVVQVAVGLERRHAGRRSTKDLDAWTADRDTVPAAAPAAEPLPQTPLRRAS